MSNLAKFYQELITQNPEFTQELLSEQDPQSLAKLAVELGKQQGYYFTIEAVEAFLAARNEDEAWRWFEVMNEFEFVDEEEKSELAEMEEDRMFYSSRI